MIGIIGARHVLARQSGVGTLSSAHCSRWHARGRRLGSDAARATDLLVSISRSRLVEVARDYS